MPSIIINLLFSDTFFSHNQRKNPLQWYSFLYQGEEIVRIKFPEHILEFNKLLEEPPFKCDNLSDIHSDLHIPVPKPFTPIITSANSNKWEALPTS